MHLKKSKKIVFNKIVQKNVFLNKVFFINKIGLKAIFRNKRLNFFFFLIKNSFANKVIFLIICTNYFS